MKKIITITIVVIFISGAAYLLVKNLQDKTPYLPGTTIESMSIIDDGNAGE